MIDRKVNVMLQLWGEIQDEEFVVLGKRYGIPTFNDCVVEVPPQFNLSGTDRKIKIWTPFD